MSELKRLILAHHEAINAENDARKALEYERKMRHQAIEKDLEAEGYMSRLHDARIARAEAERAVDEERSRVALTGEGCPVPVGSKVVKWARRHRWEKGPLVPTALGIVAVVTPTSDFDIRSHYAGDFVIRLLKKDGTPGFRIAKYARITADGLPHGWYLEGVDPNNTEEGEA